MAVTWHWLSSDVNLGIEDVQVSLTPFRGAAWHNLQVSAALFWPGTTGKWNMSLLANSCNLSAAINQNQPRPFSCISSVHLKELRGEKLFHIILNGVKYHLSLSNETNSWKIWAVRQEAHCFVLPQFYVVLAGAALKRRLFHIWGLEETAREGGMAVVL
jgi:hypothetical protein